MPIKIAPVEKDRLTALIQGRIDGALAASSGAPSASSPDFQALRSLVAQVQAAAGHVGTLPPQPPTLRAKLGSALVRLVQRMLFWYSPQIVAFQKPAAQLLTLQAEQLQRLAEETARLSESVRKEQRKVLAQLADLEQTSNELRRLHSPGKLSSAELDRFYLDFEDRFRGSRELVSQRLSVYLPIVREVQAGSADRPILDIGCGRGEWLWLLRDAGLTARGIDLNSAMIEECRARHNLDVMQADLMAYLKSVPDASLGAVTAFHIVEHLPFEVILGALDEIRRVLLPGGIVIFETPNPDNLLVGSKNFYHDLTHRNPIPSATLEFLFEHRGFSAVRTLPLNPCEPWILVEEDGSAVAKRFNQYFFGPQDYAVVGRKA
jgi:SAM-dependent methyltransferase